MLPPRDEPQLQQRLLREVQRVAKIGSWESTSDESLLWSDETLELFGVERTNFSGTLAEFFDLVHPDDLERVMRISDFADSEKSYFKSEYRIIRPDGEMRHMFQTAIVLRDTTGRPEGFSGVVQDVSDQVRTQAKLRQAQKMEAIGQLSGGVAHDFNNILAAIMGAAELLQQEESYDPDLVESIITSAQRGGELTHRLLAFARKRPLQTTRLDLTKLMADMAPMLDRLIGQDIRLELETSGQTLMVEADPAPLEEALLNLVVNARDAITGAGCITISCKPAPASAAHDAGVDFVQIVVSDTGTGMTEAVRLQATDPFFTTKPVGKGSGLGLSMVDGFVKQSGGQIRIQSVPDAGTQVSLLIPKAQSGAPSPPATRHQISKGQGESVLVIEDNHDLSALLQRQLAHLNFRATLATDRQSAIDQAAVAGGFDIVLSDVLLADGERGPYIVTELLATYPDMKPVFMTGFTSNDDTASETTLADSIVLRKPFNIDQLARVLQRVREADTFDVTIYGRA
ncbi:MAG: ATP-binding protein [Pseudomonadota bacterium]